MSESLETSEGDASSKETHFVNVLGTTRGRFGAVVAVGRRRQCRETRVLRHGPPSTISNKLQLSVDSSLSSSTACPDQFGRLIYPRLGTTLLFLPSGACSSYPAGWW